MPVANPVVKVVWKLTSYAFVIPAGIMARRATEKVWTRTRHTDPPGNPAAPGVTIVEALGWAAISGVAYAAGRMFAAQAATRMWKTLTGSLPPDVADISPDDT